MGLREHRSLDLSSLQTSDRKPINASSTLDCHRAISLAALQFSWTNGGRENLRLVRVFELSKWKPG